MEIYRFIKESPPPVIPAEGVEVLQDEWKRSEGGVLYTEEIEPCIAVAVMDPDSNTGMLGHFALGISGKTRPVFNEFIEKIEQESLGGNAQAWVSGGALLAPSAISKKVIDTYDEMLEDNKINTVNELGRVGIACVHLDWLETNQMITSVVFHIADEGSIAYQIKPIV